MSARLASPGATGWMLALVVSLAGTSALADRLIVLAKSNDWAAIVDPVSLLVQARIRTGEAPHEVAVAPDGRTAYVTNYGLSAVFRDGSQRRNEPGHTLTVIDLVSRAVRDSFDLGVDTRPHGIAVSRDGTRLWVTCEGARAVLELDAATGAVRHVWNTDQDISHMLVPTPDERKLYVANIGSGSVTVIDLGSGSIRSLISGAGTEGIDVSPDGSEVWASNRSDNTLSVIDVATDSVVAIVPGGGRMPIRVKCTPDGRHVLVSMAQSNRVAVFDRVARKRVAMIGVGAMPVGIQLTPDGKRAFVACSNDDRVRVIDLVRRRVTASFWPGSEPDGMAWVRD